MVRLTCCLRLQGPSRNNNSHRFIILWIGEKEKLVLVTKFILQIDEQNIYYESLPPHVLVLKKQSCYLQSCLYLLVAFSRLAS